jgi:hypothetical protein
MGYSGNFIYNMGTMYYVFHCVLILICLALLLSLIKRRLNNRIINRLHSKVWGYITPGLFWRLFMETNFDLIINSYI